MAAISIKVKQDTKEVERLLSGLGRGADKVITRALNRTITSVKSVAVKSIAKDIRVKQKDVREAVKLTRASFRKKTALIEASGERIPLIAFNAKQTRKGVTYRAKTGRKLIPSAFITTIVKGKNRGKKGVFRRQGKLSYPIMQLRGVSIPYVMLQQKVRLAMDSVAEDRWEKEIRHQLRFYVRSLRA